MTEIQNKPQNPIDQLLRQVNTLIKAQEEENRVRKVATGIAVAGAVLALARLGTLLFEVRRTKRKVENCPVR